MAWQCWASRPRNACNFERQAIYEDTATWGHRHRSHHRHDRRAGSSPGRRRLCDQGDRKSTRLNSSHLVISYAVFCLKKKNNDAHDVGIFNDYELFTFALDLVALSFSKHHPVSDFDVEYLDFAVIAARAGLGCDAVAL